MSKRILVTLFAIFGLSIFANQALPDKKLFIRQLFFAESQRQIDEIIEKAKQIEANYIQTYSSDREESRKMSEAHTWLVHILVSSEFRRRELMLRDKKFEDIHTLLEEAMNENMTIEQRLLAADAILDKRNELTEQQACMFVRKLLGDREGRIRTWGYAYLSALVPVDKFMKEIEKGLLDSDPGVVTNVINVVSENNIIGFYHHLYRTVQIDYDRAMSNSVLALIKIGVLGSASIPFLATVTKSHNSYSIARPALIAILFDSINVLFSGNFGCPIPASFGTN